MARPLIKAIAAVAVLGLVLAGCAVRPDLLGTAGNVSPVNPQRGTGARTNPDAGTASAPTGTIGKPAFDGLVDKHAPTPRHAAGDPTPAPDRPPPLDLAFGAVTEPATSAADACAGTPETASDYDRALDDRGPDWAAADLLERIPLDADRTAWIFGDTYRGNLTADNALEAGWSFVHSTLMVQIGNCFEVVPAFDNQSWIPSFDPELQRWPQEALVIGDELIVFAINVAPDPSKPAGLNFRQVGGTIAVYDLDDLSVPVSMVLDVPSVRGNPFGWGAMEHEGDIYLYAHEEPTGTFIAKATTDTVRRPAEWSFWDGAEWQADPAEASTVAPYRLRAFQAADGSFQAAAITFLDPALHLFSAPRPEGPWTLDDIRDFGNIEPPTHAYAYEPLAVDIGADGTIFAINFLPVDPSEIPTDVTLYGPRFLAVAPWG